MANPLKGNNDYLYVDELGSGKQGVVVRAEKRRGGNVLEPRYAAVKCIAKDPHETGGKLFDGRRSFFEALCLKMLNGLGVPRFHEVFNSETHFCISMEYISGRTLKWHISKYGGLGETNSQFVFKHLVCTIRCIHSKEIAIRDIKADNIIIEENSCIAKIVDLGFARPRASMASTKIGTPLYMAPELLSLWGDSNDYTYNAKIADIWSLGILLYYTVFGKYPYVPIDKGDESTVSCMSRAVMNHDVRFPESQPISENCRDLMLRMLTKSPQERITILEIFHHPWFNFTVQDSHLACWNIDQDAFTSDAIIQETNRAVIESLSFFPLY